MYSKSPPLVDSASINLVLIHGWALGSWIWRPLIPHLSDICKLSIIDLPGYNNVTADTTTDIDKIAQQLAIQIPPDAIIVGFSLGGLIGIKLAYQRPDLKALILLASTPCFLNHADWQQGIAAADLENLSNQLKQDKRKALQHFVRLVLNGERPPPAAIKTQLTSDILKHAPTLATLEQGLNILKQQDLRPLLAQQTLPTAIILGENDIFIRPSMPATISAINSNIHTFQIAQTAHAPGLTKPKHTAHILSSFINGL